jgi:Amt family ammonium transporter
LLADSNMVEYVGVHEGNSAITGSLHLLKWQAYAALWVIVFTACATFILLKFIGLFVPLRMSDADMEEGDIAVHGHEVYPSDIPSLGYTGGIPGLSAPSGGGGA